MDYDEFSLVSKDGGVACTQHKGFRVGGFPEINFLYWGYFEPRDIAGSNALRSISAELCAELLARASEGEEAVFQELKARVPALTHKELRQGVMGIVMLAYEQVSMLNRLKARLEGEEESEELKDDPQAMSDAMRGSIDLDGDFSHQLISELVK